MIRSSLGDIALVVTRKSEGTSLDERERKYLDMIAQFPESHLGYFSLGRYYVEVGRFAEAIAPLERCLQEEPEWTAAMVPLADALAATGQRDKAVGVLERALGTGQAKHSGIAADIEERLEELRGD